jgi:hypothetical protein
MYFACIGEESFGYPTEYHSGSLFPKYIPRNFSQHWIQHQYSSWNERHLPSFKEIRTYFGMAYAFNLLDVKKILNFDEYAFLRQSLIIKL